MKMNLYLNRDGAAGVRALPKTVKPGDVLPGVQLSPIGEWPHGECVQHVTAEACAAMVKAWEDDGKKEILVDFDHDAEDGKSTVAAAWLTNLRVDPERGLVSDFKFTDKGAEAVSTRRFRFLSPCWEVNVDRWMNGGDAPKGDDDFPAEVTPVRLVSVGLTNKPNIPVAPLLNREPQPGNKSVQQTEGTIMDKIKEALGLAPEATEEDILAALGKMKAENEECCREREEAQKAAAEKEADDFAEANAKKCNKEVVKAQYLANKEATIALVNAIPEPKAPEPKPVCNRAEAKTPTIENAADTDEKVLAKYENMTPGKAKDEFLMANAVTINRARNARAAAK
uniref:Mu-like prophage I protein n=1 Tax=uncultured bacterium fosmid pJB16B1 TaxID=1478054 RepID=A0A0H3U788_9BACT|nr:hypothetical protein [uncultured bacterium fosmid pJB16B1]